MSNLERGDYHVHVAEEMRVEDVISEAKAAGVASLGLIGRGLLLPELSNVAVLAQREGMEIRVGIEDSFVIDGDRRDFVFFDLDLKNKGIWEFYGQEAIRQRSLRVLEIQESFLKSKGFILEPYDSFSSETMSGLHSGRVVEKAISLARVVCGDERNKELIERLWSENGEEFRTQYKGSIYDGPNPSPKFVWWKYFAQGREGCVPLSYDFFQANKAVKEAGGLCLFSIESDHDMEALKPLLTEYYGLIDGVMGWHGSRLVLGKNTVRWLRERGKMILGGSDFNPKRNGEQNQWKIGTGKGDLYISPMRWSRESHRYKKP
ncbi:hypothetical protein A2368_02045 [Candidatus Collierbacteria bacterium RIFOXYB1_FULL_49_13]|uniref:Uncharacterized protein n=1 Tax=Candidatus Collierbacteria bacterium RIFOXYB1_FULL_49_13 TaxID=1817728 RepID=A0A1F5FGJ6_9BACT|nr:MAG: hypothetical protein A2368_02045 [Candidatus Collierbacteria bacterium RIFOXYB1_FULL_49_13]